MHRIVAGAILLVAGLGLVACAPSDSDAGPTAAPPTSSAPSTPTAAASAANIEPPMPLERARTVAITTDADADAVGGSVGRVQTPPPAVRVGESILSRTVETAIEPDNCRVTDYMLVIPGRDDASQDQLVDFSTVNFGEGMGVHQMLRHFSSDADAAAFMRDYRETLDRCRAYTVGSGSEPAQMTLTVDTLPYPGEGFLVQPELAASPAGLGQWFVTRVNNIVFAVWGYAEVAYAGHVQTVGQEIQERLAAADAG